MSTTTTRVGLRKPDTIDSVNVVTDLNNNWDVLDLNINFRSCTSATRPSTVWDGLAIHETDTNRQYMWNNTPASSGWYELYGAGGTISQINLAGAASGSFTLASKTTGKVNPQWELRADGVHCWGDGTSAVDTFFYRSAANALKTDGTLTIVGSQTISSSTDSTALNVSGGGTFAKSLTVGGSASLGGALGVLGLKDATTAPSSAPNNGVILYSQSSQPQWTNAQNNTYNMVGTQPGASVSNLTGPTTTETTLISAVIPANEIVQEGVYKLVAFGNLSTAATAATMTMRTYANGNGVISTGAVTTNASLATKQWRMECEYRWRSPGANANVYITTNLLHRWDGTSAPTTTPVVYNSSVTGPTMASTSAITITLTGQWSSLATTSAYILTTTGYYFQRIY